jgi:hypothetical protein
MNARVFLLALVTAAFMAVWDADRPNVVQAVVNHPRSFHDTLAKLPKISSLIPLPQGMQSGTWHVFNHDGDTLQITVDRRSCEPIQSSDDATRHSEADEQICIVTAVNGIRWCFVKVTPQVAHRADTVSR